jgi:hypothetical protein
MEGEWRLSLALCQKEREMKGLSWMVLVGDDGDGWKREREVKPKKGKDLAFWFYFLPMPRRVW